MNGIGDRYRSKSCTYRQSDEQQSLENLDPDYDPAGFDLGLPPLFGELMMQCWEEAGIPSGVINLLQGARETGQFLVNATLYRWRLSDTQPASCVNALCALKMSVGHNRWGGSTNVATASGLPRHQRLPQGFPVFSYTSHRVFPVLF